MNNFVTSDRSSRPRPGEGVVGRLKPEHLAIGVPSLDETVAWYGRMLGFVLERPLSTRQTPAGIAYMRLGDLRLKFFEVPVAASLPAGGHVPERDVKADGIRHLCFLVPDIAAAMARLRAADADVASAMSAQGQAIAVVRDCAGNLIELLQGIDGAEVQD